MNTAANITTVPPPSPANIPRIKTVHGVIRWFSKKRAADNREYYEIKIHIIGEVCARGFLVFSNREAFKQLTLQRNFVF
jgi:hypothetical protein